MAFKKYILESGIYIDGDEKVHRVGDVLILDDKQAKILRGCVKVLGDEGGFVAKHDKLVEEVKDFKKQVMEQKVIIDKLEKQRDKLLRRK